MVWFPMNENVPQMTAYLVSPLSNEELQAFKAAFELGTCAPFNLLLELKIVRPPEDYVGKSHAYIRKQEDDAGRTGPFVIIDEDATKRGGIWYIDHFATEDEVEDGEAESTAVLWKILIKTECLPITYVNYDIGNMSIGEDLDNCGVETPVGEDFEQPEVWDSGGLDMSEERYHQDTWAMAEPGEFEESTDEELRRNFMPLPDKVARLKEGIAEANGLINRWTIPSAAKPVPVPGGPDKEFPEGTVVLQLRMNPDFAWGEYRWPEESL